MVFSVHLQRSAVVAIVNCQDHGQFIGFRSLKPVAPQWIWLFQEALNQFNKVHVANGIISQEEDCIAIGLEAGAGVVHRDTGAQLSGHGESGYRFGSKQVCS
jgi:hypothetical protein